MDVLLDAECLARGLELHADVYVERLGRSGGLLVVAAVDGELRVVGVLDPAAGVVGVFRNDACRGEALVELFPKVELAREVDHRARLAPLVDHEERRDACGARHESVVGAERRGDVDDTRTVLGRHVVARDDAESLIGGVAPLAALVRLDGLDPRQQLLVGHAHELRALVAAHHLVGHQFVSRLVGVEREPLGLLVEVGVEQRLGHHDRGLLACVGVVGAHGRVVDLRTHAQRRVRGERPRRGGPRQKRGGAPALHLGLGREDAELRHDGRVLHVAVAARLVQLVRREARAGGRRVGLDGVALVEQPLVEELLEQPPERLDVFVVVGDVGVLHVDPVAHLARELLPHARELHDGLAAGAVVLLDRDRAADVLLGDAQLLLHAQLDGQAVGVPARLAVDQIALLGLVAAEDVLDRAGHDVVDARHAVGRRGPFVEDERGVTLARGDALAEGVAGVPFGEDLGGDARQIESFVLLELHGMGCFAWQSYEKVGKINASRPAPPRAAGRSRSTNRRPASTRSPPGRPAARRSCGRSAGRGPCPA